MYLKEEKSDLLETEIRNLKGENVIQDGLSQSINGISLYDEREINTIIEASKGLFKNSSLNRTLDGNSGYSLALIKSEFKKIESVIKENSQLEDKYLALKEKVSTLIKLEKCNKDADYAEFSKMVMYDIIRLQAILGIMPNLCCVEIIEDLANELCIGIVNRNENSYAKIKQLTK